MYENIFQARQENELKIQRELDTINQIRKCMNETNDQTNRMTHMLNTFETRLSTLHDIIMPVYDATTILRIKQENLHRTIDQLDSIIEYYNSVKNLSKVIQAGPGKDINNYLSHLNKLKSAIEYFAINKNQSQRTQNVCFLFFNYITFFKVLIIRIFN